jgi:hypothetical protein
VLSCQRCQARHQAFERQRAEFLAAAPSFAVHAQKFVPQRASRAARAFEAKRRPPLLAAGVIAIAAAIAFMLLPSSHETRLKGGL